MDPRARSSASLGFKVSAKLTLLACVPPRGSARQTPDLMHSFFSPHTLALSTVKMRRLCRGSCARRVLQNRDVCAASHAKLLSSTANSAARREIGDQAPHISACEHGPCRSASYSEGRREGRLLCLPSPFPFFPSAFPFCGPHHSVPCSFTQFLDRNICCVVTSKSHQLPGGATRSRVHRSRLWDPIRCLFCKSP